MGAWFMRIACLLHVEHSNIQGRARSYRVVSISAAQQLGKLRYDCILEEAGTHTVAGGLDSSVDLSIGIIHRMGLPRVNFTLQR